MYLFTWKGWLQREKERGSVQWRGREREWVSKLLFTGSLSKWPQCLEMGQAIARELKLYLGLPHRQTNFYLYWWVRKSFEKWIAYIEKWPGIFLIKLNLNFTDTGEFFLCQPSFLHSASWTQWWWLLPCLVTCTHAVDTTETKGVDCCGPGGRWDWVQWGGLAWICLWWVHHAWVIAEVLSLHLSWREKWVSVSVVSLQFGQSAWARPLSTFILLGVLDCRYQRAIKTVVAGL